MKKLIQLIERKKLNEASEYLAFNESRLTNRDRLFFSGLLCQLKGNKNIAEEKYLKLLQEDSRDLAAIVNLAAIYNDQGNYSKSLELLSSVKRDTPYSQYQMALFDTYFGLRNNDEAEAVLLPLLKSNDDVELIERYASLLLQQDKLTESVNLLLKLAEKYGDSRPQIYGNLAVAFNRLGEHERGLLYATKASQAKPDSWKFRLNQANSLMSLERTNDAEEILQKLLQQGYRASEILGNMARIENMRGNIEKSITYCDEALIKSPADSTILCCLADNLAVLGNSEQAYCEYKKSLEFRPADELTNWHLALTLLRDGRYQEGWEQYKWGFKRKRGGRGLYKFDKAKEWNGEEIAAPLLVWGEQGIGDELMFSKFLKYLPNSMSQIELRIDARLIPVLSKRLISQKKIIFKPYSDECPIGAHIPIGNLPSILWSNYEKDSDRLKPFLARVAHKKKTNIRIGIAWRGGKTERMQSKRSVPLGLFRRLNSLLADNVQLVMLQYNPLPEEVAFLQAIFKERVSLPGYDAYKDLEAWVDHIDSCDLLISVDNSAVHFAGAMGIPTLAMIPQYPDFRWGRSGDTNVWYESVKLLRNSDKTGLDELAKRVDEWITARIEEINHELHS